MKTVDQVKQELREVIMNACEPLGPKHGKREITNGELGAIDYAVHAYLVSSLDVQKKTP